METYQEFLNRINSFEKSEAFFGEGRFKSNPSLAKKVNPDNSFRDFFGDTVVFDLDIPTKKRLEKWLDKLYDKVPECFCERLATDMFHMTLHDLSNSEIFPEIGEELAENEKKVLQRFKDIEVGNTIKMRSMYIFNMVNTSLVLGLYPTDENEYKKLMALYQVFDEVKKLDYPLTPHITLAYYNVNGFDEEAARKLEKLVQEINTCELNHHWEVPLDVRELYYQRFQSMNDYTNVLSLSNRR